MLKIRIGAPFLRCWADRFMLVNRIFDDPHSINR